MAGHSEKVDSATLWGGEALHLDLVTENSGCGFSLSQMH